MKILLSNDDGVRAEGLAALRAAVSDLGDVTVVAPTKPQSGVGHAVTLTELAARRVCIQADVPFEAIAVDGMPADCVRLAILKLLPEPPDLVLSGINAGANVGIHVFYSGTVAAATEAALLGVPAVAFSLEVEGPKPPFARPARWCREVLDRLLARGMTGGDLISVNVPAPGPGRPRGVKVARQARARFADVYQRKPGASEEIYQIAGNDFQTPRQDTDAAALAEGYVTITPLGADRTDFDKLARLSGDDWNKPPS